MTSNPSPTRPSPRWPRLLKWTRRGWLVLAGLLFIVFLMALPGTYQMLQTPCGADLSGCESWRPAGHAGFIRRGRLIAAVGGALFHRTVRGGLARILGRGLAGFSLAPRPVVHAAGGVSVDPARNRQRFTGLCQWPLLHEPAARAWALVGLLLVSMYQVMSLFFITFPNGRIYGRWNFIPFVLICLNTFFWVVPSSTLNLEAWPSQSEAPGCWSCSAVN